MIKVIIVDDEKWIRKGIAEKANWEELGADLVAEACNGYEAMELIRNLNPEIVITDMNMPEMDGVDLLCCLQNEFPDIKVIIISGYSDFEYTKNAIIYKAFDYILKPINSKSLNIILKNAIRQVEIQHEEKWKAIEMQKNASLLRVFEIEKALNKLIDGTYSNLYDLSEELSKMGLQIDFRYFIVFVVNVLNYGSIAKSLFGGQYELLDSSVLATLKELGCGYNMITFKSANIENSYVILMCRDDDYFDYYHVDTLYDLCRKYKKTFYENWGINVRVGIGKRYAGKENIQLSFKDALYAIEMINLNSESEILYADNVNHHEILRIIPDEEIYQLLFKSLKDGDHNTVRIMIDNLFRSIRSKEYLTVSELSGWMIKFFIRIEKELELYYINFNDVLGRSMIAETEEIIKDHTLDEMQICLQAIFDKIMVFIKEKFSFRNKEVIESVKKYINEHYNEKIRLNELADKFYINDTYFCKIFKKETGIGFMDYLTSVRMEKAKTLMNNRKLRIYELAGMVGYDDVRYFSKMFKKYMSSEKQI